MCLASNLLLSTENVFACGLAVANQSRDFLRGIEIVPCGSNPQNIKAIVWWAILFNNQSVRYFHDVSASGGKASHRHTYISKTLNLTCTIQFQALLSADSRLRHTWAGATKARHQSVNLTGFATDPNTLCFQLSWLSLIWLSQYLE